MVNLLRRSPLPSRVAFCAATVLTAIGPAFAHHAVEQPNLGQLILGQEIVARGTIVGASRMERGTLVARLRADVVLKGKLPAMEIDFASDPDHGVRYQAGERVVVFLTRADRKQPPFVSAQVFSMKYAITSFDPSGYDGLVTGMLEAERIADDTARSRKRKEVLFASLGSHERSVRSYAAGELPALTKRAEVWDVHDWRRVQTIARQDNLDVEVRHALRRLLDSIPSDVVRHAPAPSGRSPK